MNPVGGEQPPQGGERGDERVDPPLRGVPRAHVADVQEDGEPVEGAHQRAPRHTPQNAQGPRPPLPPCQEEPTQVAQGDGGEEEGGEVVGEDEGRVHQGQSHVDRGREGRVVEEGPVNEGQEQGEPDHAPQFGLGPPHIGQGEVVHPVGVGDRGQSPRPHSPPPRVVEHGPPRGDQPQADHPLVGREESPPQEVEEFRDVVDQGRVVVEGGEAVEESLVRQPAGVEDPQAQQPIQLEEPALVVQPVHRRLQTGEPEDVGRGQQEQGQEDPGPCGPQKRCPSHPSPRVHGASTVVRMA